MLNHLAQLLHDLVQRELPSLHQLAEHTASQRHGTGTGWSAKEELGHLIDSAVNNHVRFVCAAIQPEFRGLAYKQDDWVRIHAYQDMPWSNIVVFWAHYNNFLAQLLTAIPYDKLQTPCYLGDADPVTLEFLVEDYILHAQHHLDHMLGRENITAYPRP